MSEATPQTRRLLDPFSLAPFRRALLAAVCFSLGQWTERIAVGWYVFDATDSAFATGLAMAAQSIPNIIFGPVAGALSDRYPRPRLLALACVLKVAMLLGIAGLVRLDDAPLAPVFLLVGLSGIGMTMSTASLQTLAGDLVPGRRASAISLVSTGQRSVAAVGAIASGIIVGTAGPAWSFLFSAVALLLAAVGYGGLREPASRHASEASLLGDTVEGVRLIGRVPMVATLLALMVVAEIFGFSYISLLPALAERTLDVGPVGLGGLSAIASVGSVAGTLFLAGYGERVRHGLLLIAVFAAFGVLLAGLGWSRVYLVSLLAAAGIGACTALIDALEWIMLQSSVAERLRGRAIGAWNVAIGFGWIGPLLLGGLADTISITVAFSVAGAMLGIAAVTAVIFVPRLRG